MSGDGQDVERDIRAYAARSYGQAIEERPAAMIRWLLTALDDERRRYNELAQEAYEAEETARIIERLLSDDNDELVIGRSAGAFYARMHGDLSPRRSRETLADALRALAAQIERATP